MFDRAINNQVHRQIAELQAPTLVISSIDESLPVFIIKLNTLPPIILRIEILIDPNYRNTVLQLQQSLLTLLPFVVAANLKLNLLPLSSPSSRTRIFTCLVYDRTRYMLRLLLIVASTEADSRLDILTDGQAAEVGDASGIKRCLSACDETFVLAGQTGPCSVLHEHEAGEHPDVWTCGLVAFGESFGGGNMGGEPLLGFGGR